MIILMHELVRQENEEEEDDEEECEDLDFRVPLPLAFYDCGHMIIPNEVRPVHYGVDEDKLEMNLEGCFDKLRAIKSSEMRGFIMKNLNLNKDFKSCIQSERRNIQPQPLFFFLSSEFQFSQGPNERPTNRWRNNYADVSKH